MASHKSAKKRIRTNAIRREINKSSQSRIKTAVKKALKTTDKAEAEKIYKETISVLDKGAAKGYLHPNNAARKKSAITKHLNSLEVKEQK
jgi:small subunit ribosomal protein S20